MSVRDERDLGAVVRAERLQRNLDQRELAAGAGIALSALRRLEAGDGTTLRTAFAVLRALDLPMEIPHGTAPRRRRAAPLPRTPSGLTRRAERTSWFLHRAVAAKLRSGDHHRVVHTARQNLPALRSNARGPQAQAWLDRWETALDGSTKDLIELMLRTDTEGVDLRQVSPFAGALTTDERVSAIRQAVGT